MSVLGDFSKKGGADACSIPVGSGCISRTFLREARVAQYRLSVLNDLIDVHFRLPKVPLQGDTLFENVL